MENGQIQGLLSLLSDESERVQEQVESHLRNLGQEGLTILDRAQAHEDPDIRDRAGDLRRRLAHEFAEAILADECEKPEPNLLAYHQGLAALESPGLDLSHIALEIERLQAEAKRRLSAISSLHGKARALAHFLHDDEGFIGDGENYDDPRNSYLHHVLERRVGIPISLCAIYLLVGRAAGLEMAGVGMPCHFLVRIKEDDEEVLVDPFGGGRILSREDTKALLSGFERGFRDDYLRSVTDRALLTRALANLVRLYDARGQDALLQRTATLMAKLQSDRPPNA